MRAPAKRYIKSLGYLTALEPIPLAGPALTEAEAVAGRAEWWLFPRLPPGLEILRRRVLSALCVAALPEGEEPMSAALPTEEDVLMALVLRASRPVVTNIDSTEQSLNAAAWDQAVNVARVPWEDPVPAAALEIAYRRMAEFGDVEEAIADSERRYAVECAEQAVINAALEWRDTPTALASEGLESAVDAMLHAETEAR